VAIGWGMAAGFMTAHWQSFHKTIRFLLAALPIMRKKPARYPQTHMMSDWTPF